MNYGLKVTAPFLVNGKWVWPPGYTCAHVWNMSDGEADECGGNIRCVKCDIDGDA